MIKFIVFFESIGFFELSNQPKQLRQLNELYNPKQPIPEVSYGYKDDRSHR